MALSDSSHESQPLALESLGIIRQLQEPGAAQAGAPREEPPAREMEVEGGGWRGAIGNPEEESEKRRQSLLQCRPLGQGAVQAGELLQSAHASAAACGGPADMAQAFLAGRVEGH